MSAPRPARSKAKYPVVQNPAMARAPVLALVAVAMVAAGVAVSNRFVPSDDAAKPGPGGPSGAAVVGAQVAAPAGGESAPASGALDAKERFRLTGVMASGSPGGEGVALISVDGGPAQAFRVGATVAGDIVVREVSARGAVLGPRDGQAGTALEVTAAPPPEAPAPAPNPNGLTPAEQEIVRVHATKHPPLPQPSATIANTPVIQPRDDGSWKPAQPQ